MSGIIIDDVLDRIVVGNTDQLIAEVWDKHGLLWQYDSVAPTLIVSYPTGENESNPTRITTSSITVSGTAFDLDSGIRRVVVNDQNAILDGENWSITLDLEVNTTIPIVIYAEDKAGNASESIIRYVYADTVAPTLTVTNPAANALVTATTITVSGTVSDASGIRSVTVNGTAATINTSTGAWSCSITPSTPGTIALTVIATDNVGRTTTVTRTVNYIYNSSGSVLTIYNNGSLPNYNGYTGGHATYTWTSGQIYFPDSHTAYAIFGAYKYICVYVSYFSKVSCKVYDRADGTDGFDFQTTPGSISNGNLLGTITGTGWWKFPLKITGGYSNLGIFVWPNPYYYDIDGSANIGSSYIYTKTNAKSSRNYPGGEIRITQIYLTSS